ncbi:uncharacterized protein [Rhodnius prolixus]|uniref:uncharacterized protein n=1 Tax=Rhodnius prolixus TaxID=13249 RepID=UPI003D18DC63
MEEILDVNKKVNFEERITDFEFHSHQPFNQSFENSDEIIIAVQHQDIYTVPAKSFLYIQGQLIKEGSKTIDPSELRIVRNGFLFLFDEIKYQLNGVLVDHVRNPGITSTLKNYASLSPDKASGMEMSGWMMPTEYVKLADENGNFDACIPLDIVMGFFEDYNQIILNGKHELILHRSRTDNDSIQVLKDHPNVKASIKLKSVQWKMPYVKVSDEQRLKFLSLVNKGKTVHMAFRSWDLVENPSLPTNTNKQTWSVKTSTNLEKPRYIIIAFQTNKKNNAESDMSQFNHCSISNVKLHLNSEVYPYDDLNIDFSKNHFTVLYYMYRNFQHSYYAKENQPLLSREEFRDEGPIIVIDCSRQSEAIRSSSVDIRIDLETTENFKANTTVYALILHDALVQYDPLSGLVRRI